MEDKVKLGNRLVVVGAGAAGFFCAVNAARMNPTLEVTIVEKTSKLLSKVKVSGGGRCNVTTDTISWFEERGVTLKAEADGRMFPVTDSSQTIIDCLLKEANIYKVQVLMNREVKEIHRSDSGFRLAFSNGDTIEADFVCIACGGYPKSVMFDWIRNLGHTIEEPLPSLFTFNMPGNPITSLMGVVADPVKIKIIGSKLQETGPLLITHWGMSGPAVLKLSAWGARELAQTNWKFTVHINWLATHTEQTLKVLFQEWRLTKAATRVWSKNELGIPNRLWEFLLNKSVISESMRWADLPGKSQQLLINHLCAFSCEVNGKTTFKEEFVTAGGIKLKEVDPSTMMSKLVRGVFFAGEILDVDGITGGFNFQHAWTSGYIAAKTIGEICGDS
jgi:predicted Rossmann fold flavoprotein